MDVAQVLELVKARLGITTEVRDAYLTAIIEGIIKELTDEKGLVLDGTNPYHLMFVVDFATWRYQSVGDGTTAYTGQPMSMPRHLQFRLHNLMIHAGGGASDV